MTIFEYSIDNPMDERFFDWLVKEDYIYIMI